MERKLSAILVADVVGYSSMMDKDETSTLADLSALIDDLIKPLISHYRGRLVKLMGDGVLAEFVSVVDAVSCAVSWQQELTDKQGEIQFRIGINLGEIIVQDDDIFGNGVNIAARLESLALPGGVCISESVHREVKKVLDIECDDLGPRRIKNISEPVHAFQVRLQSAPSPGQQRPREPRSVVGSKSSEKPTVTVLPFANKSGDPEQDFFSEGISQDIATGLSRFRTLSVVTTPSAQFGATKPTSHQQNLQHDQAQYFVEGSVRKSGKRVRVSAQLIEAGTGNNLWAERYDRDLEDVFEVQDEVARAVIAVLPGLIQHHVAERTTRKNAENMKPYELLLQGKALRDGLNAKGTAAARILYQRALELDPNYARAYMYLADTYIVDSWLGLANEDAAGNTLKIARRGAAIDNKDVYIQDQLGYAFLCAGLWQDADVQFEKTLQQIVNEAESMAWCGYGFLMLGRHEKALEVVEEAIQLDPMHPPALDWIMGQIYFFLGRYDDVIRVLIGEALLNSLADAFLVAAYAHSGRKEEASRALAAFIEHRHAEFGSRGLLVDTNSISSLAGGFQNMWRHEEDWLKLAQGLRSAGLPD